MKRILPLFLCVILLCGCSVRPLPGMELSRRLIVEAIGIDTDGGDVLLTLQAIDPAAGGATSEERPKPVNYRFRAATVAQAVSAAAQSTGKVPFFAYARILLFGKHAAEAGLADHLDFFLRNRTVRNTVPVCVAETSACELLNTELSASGSPAKTIAETLRANEKNGRCALAPFFSFVNRMRAPDTEAFCPLIETNAPADDGPLLFSCAQTAVFSGDRFRFRLSDTETTFFLLALNPAEDVFLEIRSDSGLCDCRLQQIKTKIRVKDNAAALWVRARAVLLHSSGQIPLPASDITPASAVDEALRKTLQAGVESCLRRIYGEYGADLLRLRKRNGQGSHAPAGGFSFTCSVRITK